MLFSLLFMVNLSVADVMISPSFYNFGSVSVNSQRSATLFVRNMRNEPINSLYVSDNCFMDFYVSSSCFGPLQPHGSCSINVYFRPTRQGYQSCNINVQASMGGSASANISGTGIEY